MDYCKLITFALVTFASSLPNAHAFSQGQFPTSAAGNITTFGTGTVGGGALGSGTVSFASDGTLLSKGPVSFTGAGGSKVTAELTAKASKAAVGKALANFAFKGLPFLGTAVALYALYDELGLGKSPSGAPTKPVSTVPGKWRHDYTGEFKFDSRDAACADIFNGLAGRVFLRYGLGPYDPPGYPERCIVQGAPSEGNTYYVNMIFAATGPAVITQEPMTREQLENAIAAKSGWPTSSSLGSAAKNALDSGEVAQAEPEFLAGPASSPGEKTTTTNPDGTTTTTTTTNNYVYNGPNVTVTTTTVTQNYNTQGAPTGNPTVTTKQPAQPAEAPKPDPEKDLCQKYPDIVACAKLDTPDAKDVKNKDVSVSIIPDSGWGPASGSCPAPRVLALHGLTTEYSWQPMCDFALGIRGVILAVAWLIAAGSVVGMARKE